MNDHGWRCGCHHNHKSQEEHDRFWQRYYARRKAKLATKKNKKKGRVKFGPSNPPTARSKRRRKNKPNRRQFARLKKGGYRRYILSPEWAAKVQEAHKHYGHQCTICGTKDGLHVHHRHYETLYRERMKDLDLLCGGCHQNEHEKDGVVDPMTRRFLDMVAGF